MLDGIIQAYDKFGPLGVAIIAMFFLVIVTLGLAWQIWKSKVTDRQDQREISKKLADTQDKLVDYVTVDSAHTREALNANTRSNLTAAEAGAKVKESMDALLLKLGSDPGCKVIDPKLMCKAQEMGISHEEIVRLAAHIKETQVSILEEKKRSNEFLETLTKDTALAREIIRKKADADAKALESLAMDTAHELIETAVRVKSAGVH